MAGEMKFSPFRQKTLPSALATASEGGAAALGFHAGAKAVLSLAGAL
jgi:hypothetical protein